MNSKLKTLSPNRVIVFGFSFIILVGALLLNMDIATINRQSVGFVNALFTSVSCVCVTGLVAVDTGTTWSLFGRTVVITLIQIGGLGFMSMATLGALVLGRKISLRERILIKESFNENKLDGMVRLIKKIVTITLTIELIGAIFLSFVYIPEHGFINGVGHSIFHSISAFCNAGFDLNGNYSSLTKYVTNPIINITIALLIMFGGLGFSVILDINRKKSFKKLYLHTKLVVVTTALLIIIPFVMFFFIEYNNPDTLQNLTFGEKMLATFFQVVTPRTAGFNTLDLAKLKSPTKLIMLILMFIGGSPASTAGGVKTTTIAVVFCAVISQIKARSDIEAFKRRIPYKFLNKALTVLIVGMVFDFIGIVSISLIEPHVKLMDVAFEVVSAYGTVGLTLGITQSLKVISKCILMFLMFSGRVGSLTVIYALMKTGSSKLYSYAKEDIMVG